MEVLRAHRTLWIENMWVQSKLVLIEPNRWTIRIKTHKWVIYMPTKRHNNALNYWLITQRNSIVIIQFWLLRRKLNHQLKIYKFIKEKKKNENMNMNLSNSTLAVAIFMEKWEKRKENGISKSAKSVTKAIEIEYQLSSPHASCVLQKSSKVEKNENSI